MGNYMSVCNNTDIECKSNPSIEHNSGSTVRQLFKKGITPDCQPHTLQCRIGLYGNTAWPYQLSRTRKRKKLTLQSEINKIYTRKGAILCVLIIDGLNPM